MHYACFDGDQIDDLFRTVESGLNDNDFDGLRPFLGLFEALLEQTHANFVKRREAFLGRFLEACKHHIGFYKWMEAIFEFIWKITTKNAAVRQWFYDN